VARIDAVAAPMQSNGVDSIEAVAGEELEPQESLLPTSAAAIR
jgi:hypothetical protein